MRFILFALLFILFFLLSFTIIPGVDTFWQVKTGEVIVKQGIPHQDIFSYTAQGEKWVVHEWLSDVIFHFIYKINPNLLLIFKGVTIALAFLILAFICLEELALLPVLVLLLSATASRIFFDVRPQIFSYLFFALLLFLLYRNYLLFIPPLFLLWCNLHSGFILGLLVLFLWTMEAVWKNVDRKKWLLIFFLSFLLTFVNPNGWHLYQHAFDLLGWKEVQDVIVEWLSPNFHRLDILPFEVLLFVFFFSFLFSPKIRAIDLALGVLLVHFSLQAVRHIPIFAILSTPLIVFNFKEVSQSLEDRLGRITKPIALFFPFLLSISQVIALPPFDDMFSVFVEYTEHFFPIGNVKKIKLEKGNLYNEYKWGGYLIFHCYPEKKVFIDGRAEVYKRKGVLNDYFSLWNAVDNWEALRKKYDIKLFLLDKSAPLSKVLKERKDFRLIGEDLVSYLFKYEPKGR
ncbi:MAG: hypothetical protein ACP5KZ_07740 [bacterium]